MTNLELFGALVLQSAGDYCTEISNYPELADLIDVARKEMSYDISNKQFDIWLRNGMPHWKMEIG